MRKRQDKHRPGGQSRQIYDTNVSYYLCGCPVFVLCYTEILKTFPPKISNNLCYTKTTSLMNKFRFIQNRKENIKYFIKRMYSE